MSSRPSRPPIALKGAVVLLTGASRGLGPVIADLLAQRGADLVLAARNARELDAVAERLRPHGVRVLTVPTDVADRGQLTQLAQRAEAELGRVDVLINNAALEQLEFFEQLSEADADKFVAVNLTAPIQLTRLLLPGMITRGVGHVVNIASIAGFGPAAFGETYGATKAGIVGFTRSLRASMKTVGSPISASVVCPGFVTDAGMFADMQATHAVRSPHFMLGTCTPDEVAQTVLRAIERDDPELFVGRRPMRVMMAIGLLFPRIQEFLSLRLGINEIFHEAARSARDKADKNTPQARP
ncbi:MAG: SDR family NAD(P)-dependent oxidoreductase [Polyangiales bacterium]